MDTMRGFHCIVRSREGLRALAEAVERHLAPMGVNTVVAQVDDSFLFRSHPELSRGDIDAGDAARFARRCMDSGVVAIPLYNCLGHQGWRRDRNALLTAHPEFDETRLAGGPDPADFYCPSWCATDDGVYRYVLPAIDEIAEAFGSSILHIGMDEVFEIGKCPRCKGMDRSDLFARTVNILHAHLAARGVRTMMWGDRYLDGAVLKHEWEADVLGIHPAAGKVPKDILIADWHYEPGEFPSVGMLLDHGFETVWPSCWKDAAAALSFLRSARAQAAGRGTADRVPGMLVTCWSVGPQRFLAVLGGAEDTKDDERAMVESLRSVMQELTA